MEKECFKCGSLKPLAEFYKHKSMRDGHLNKCKDCARADARNAPYNPEYEQMRNQLPHRKEARKKYAENMRNDPEAMKRQRASQKKSADKYAIKRAARIIWGNHKRKMDIENPICERCNIKQSEHAHHEDYTKPLDVVWLCLDCHGERHREINHAIKVLGEDWSERGF